MSPGSDPVRTPAVDAALDELLAAVGALEGQVPVMLSVYIENQVTYAERLRATWPEGTEGREEMLALLPPWEAIGRLVMAARRATGR